MTSTKKKIVIIVPPATGHVNPICGIAYQLTRDNAIDEVIFYGEEQHRQLIEHTGSTYRQYSHPIFSRLTPKKATEKQDGLTYILNLLITYSFNLLPQFLADITVDKPDMIIVDAAFLPGKYLIEILRTRNDLKHIKCAMFAPNFALNEAVMAMNPALKLKIDFATIISFIVCFLRQFWLSWTYGISVYNPVKAFLASHDHLNIVAVLPQLQPRLKDFDPRRFKFVGPCISEPLRSLDIRSGDEKLNSILNLFPENRNNETMEANKLVYVSLGTIFNHNFYIFEAVIEAIWQFDEVKFNRTMKMSQLRFIFSVGKSGCAYFEEKQGTQGYQIPSNVVLCAFVPQLEVLKRAALFITHAGMTSTSEAIKYGVPMICVPLFTDQPLNAMRVCDELVMGKRLDALSLEAGEIGDAIDEVLSNGVYGRNVREMARVTDEYNGVVEATRVIVEYCCDRSEVDDSMRDGKKSN
jgi:UDP:flavonoid glycosyltransferase YjiC (YdhE family)